MRKWTGIFLILLLMLALALPVAGAELDSPILFARNDTAGYWLAVAGACLIAGICTLVVWNSMNNVRQQDDAHRYTTGGGLRLTGRYERFLRRTRTRRKIEKNNS